MNNFNSHAHVERDDRTTNVEVAMIISTHTLTWSVTIFPLTLNSAGDISTHTLTWSVTNPVSEFLGYQKFQLTRSRGAWLTIALWKSSDRIISTHTLTWSVTAAKSVIKMSQKDFNSHAHVERDIIRQNKEMELKISTHTLTWSVTVENGKVIKKSTISTHTLTWSVTYATLPLLLFWLFQLTRSRGAWR